MTADNPLMGTVKFFKASHGYGFITRDDGSGDVFCGSVAVNRNRVSLYAGDAVEFTITTDRNGRPEVNSIRVL
jgi:cold shock protein